MQSVVVELAGLFAQAAVDGTQWLTALQALADATRSTRAQLVGFGEDNMSWFNWVTNGHPPEAVAAFERSLGTDPRGNTRRRVSLGDPLFTLRSEDDYGAVPNDAFSRRYRELCHAAEMLHGCQTTLSQTADGQVGLALLRSDSDGVSSGEQRALFMAVAPHVRNAVVLQRAIESQGRMLLAGALEEMSATAFICGPDARVRAMTRSAEQLCAAGRFVLQQGVLHASTLKETRRLHQAIARQAEPLPAPATLIVALSDQRVPLIVDISVLPALPWRLERGSDILVAVRGGRRWHKSAPAVLESFYKLSPAEADVAMRVARGMSRDEVAAARGTSVGTVKAQLKSIFAKLDVSREAELIVLLNDHLSI